MANELIMPELVALASVDWQNKSRLQVYHFPVKDIDEKNNASKS